MEESMAAAGKLFVTEKVLPLAYLSVAGIATLGWIYALAHGTWVLIGWTVGYLVS